MGRADLLKFPLLCEGKVDFVAIFETGRSEANGPMMAILMPSWFQQRFPSGNEEPQGWRDENDSEQAEW